MFASSIKCTVVVVQWRQRNVTKTYCFFALLVAVGVFVSFNSRCSCDAPSKSTHIALTIKCWMRLSMIWGTDYADQGGCYPPKTSVALFLSSILLLRSIEPGIWLFPFRNACKNIPPKKLSSCALSDSDDLGQFLAGSVGIPRACVLLAVFSKVCVLGCRGTLNFC